MTDYLGWLAATANLLGFAQYFRALGDTKSSTSVGWFLSAVIALSSAFSQIGVSNFSNSVSYFIGALCCGTAFVFSVQRRSFLKTAEKWTACVAVLIAVLAVAAPAWSIYFVSAYYLLTYSVFVRAINSGTQEPLLPWVYWCAGAVIQIFSIALSDGSPQAYVLPITNLLCWVCVLLMASRRFQFQWSSW